MENKELTSYKLIQWNVLASGEFFCNQSSFPQVDKKYLTWEHRKNLFYEIIRKLNADLFCLEEIDDYEKIKNDVFDDLLTTYSSIYYSKKTGGQGIALFYKNDFFELLHSYNIFYRGENPGIISNQFFSIYFMKEKKQNKTFCLIITHLKAKKEFEELRKIQVNHLCETINQNEEFLQFYKKFNCQSLILCGDFNTEPNFESIQNLINYRFNAQNLDKLESAYNIFNNSTSDYLECSTFKIRESENYRVIDYIFCAGKINVNSVEKVPTKNSKEWETILKIGLPCSFFPSDHHFLGINFELI